jgi:hypothetical protein
MTANMYRYRVNLGGWTGAPGLNTWYVRFAALPIIADVQGVADLLRTGYDSLKGKFGTGYTVDIDPQVDVIEDTTGLLQSSTVITPPAQVVGTDTGKQVSRATHILARLNTDSVINGRRLKGRIFLGPISSSGMDLNGQITAATMASVSTAFSGLIDLVGGRLVVWHRPSSAGSADGDSGFVQSVTCKPVPATLRSRRD